nr:unnamed protein product [Callosobruchus chinensis]
MEAKSMIANNTFLIFSYENSGMVQKEDFAHFLGNIVACCSAMKYAWAYSKRLERGKYFVLKTAANNYDSKMEIDVSLKADFDWWLDKLPTAKKSIKIDHYDMEIFSDSSLTGWGAYTNG